MIKIPTFEQGLGAIFAVVVLNVILTVTNGYAVLNQIDILMHLLGGFTFGILGFAVWKYAFRNNKQIKYPDWALYIFIVGFVLIIGVAWEFHEFILDQSINAWYHLPISQISIFDTMKDLLNDWIGATVAFFIWRKTV